MGALPLRLRAPNPPAVFVGRDEELRWLREATTRSPVTLVTGPEGIGKSAMVRSFLANLEDAICVRVVGDPWRAIARALAEVHSVEVVWGELADADALMALTLDLAERGPAHVLVEDLHEAPLDDATRCLAILARYARGAQFIVTSRRTEERPFLIGQQRVLDGLDDDSLATIVAHARPDARPEQVRAWVADSAGSPQRLLGLVYGMHLDDPWGDLPDAARSVLAMTTTFDATLPTELVGDVDALVSRGWIVRGPRGVRAHSSAPKGELPRAERERVARTLLQSSDAECLLAAMRVLGPHPETVRCVLGAGYAFELWPLLGEADWQLRAETALAMGEADALASITAPEDPGELWARLLVARGDLEQAERVFDAIEDLDAAGRCARALASMGRGDFEAALGVLHDENARELGLRASCHAALGRAPEAREQLRRAEAAGDPGLNVARTYYLLGDVRGAARNLDRIFAATTSVMREGRGRWTVALQAMVRLDLADAEGSAAALDALERCVGAHPILEATLGIGRIGLALLHDDLDGAESRIHAVERSCAGLTEHAAMCAAQRVILNIRRCAPPPTELPDVGVTGSEQLLRALSSLARAQHGVVDPPVSPNHPEAQLVEGLTLATQALVAGDANTAARTARDVERDAEQRGFLVRAREARELATLAEQPDDAWTIVVSAQRIVLPNGELDLSSRRVLWAIVDCLVRRGGAASKEEIVKDVWDVEYHPLRHDNRLQSAIRKLRKLLDDPSRIETREDGYGLGKSHRIT